MPAKRSLKDVLGGFTSRDASDGEDIDDHGEESSVEYTEEDPSMCVDCGDQPRELECLDCHDGFCRVCFTYIHRTGNRKNHRTHNISSEMPVDKTSESLTSHPSAGNESPAKYGLKSESTVSADIEADDVAHATSKDFLSKSDKTKDALMAKFKANTKYIPIRLSMEERRLFRLLEAALHVSEYTDKVDILSYTSKTKRIVAQLREMCTVLTGLVVANGLDVGRALVDGKDFSEHAEWYQSLFEIGRRYKIMNPERMRSTYGKLAYMIMDSRLPEVRDVLEFDLYKPVVTVWQVLEECGALEILDDPLVLTATREISAEKKPRHQIQAEIRAKERAIITLSRRVSGSQTQERVMQALYSIGDYHAYLGANRIPVKRTIERLTTQFDPEDEKAPLAISMGRQGARLSHNHRKQYQYVLQSLTLWSEIMRDMYMLWKLADEDLMADTMRYQLQDTGQGLNRVKPSPKVGRAMHNIIARAQKETGSWVGSSVVHLGDRAVPNALFFLDKYLQVPRILNPVNTALRLLPEILGSDAKCLQWVRDQFGSPEALEHTILTDFFRHAFDGSGADNFYDAGSCIDGRLTSAWNWANMLPRKSYYKHFLITGFVGFDGTEGF